jgi:hypothetical protein
MNCKAEHGQIHGFSSLEALLAPLRTVDPGRCAGEVFSDCAGGARAQESSAPMSLSRRAVAYRTSPPPRRLDLDSLTDRQLLGVRLCDLGLRFAGSELEARASALHAELARRGIAFRPHLWLSTEWFSPDGVPGFAIPFYLAHPRLTALEAKQMREVEGGTPRSFMQLMRHETGHALDSAYRVHERTDWQAAFGPFNAPYRRHYQERPYSKRFVRHLDNGYAQSHPAEDFAETFAVWLDPQSHWRTRYHDWPALEKLSYVNRLMRQLARKEPLVRSRELVEPLASLTITLGAHYEEKRRRYGISRSFVYERDLRRLFRERKPGADGLKAASYLKHARPKIRKLVADSTGAFQYDIDRVLREMIARSAKLDLVVANGGRPQNGRTTQRVAAQLARYLEQGHHRHAR